MKNILLSALLLPAAAVTVQAATLPFPDIATAKAQAAKSGKPALIVWYGSDWQPNVESFCKNWQEFAANNASTYIFGQFDDKLGLEGGLRNKALPIEHFNLPAVIMLAPDGSFMAECSGSMVKTPGNELQQQLAAPTRMATRFAELAQKARGSEGKEALLNAATALYLLPAKDAMRNKELTGIINKYDPQDESGFRAQFCLDHLGMYGEINGILKGGKTGKLAGKDRKFDEAEAYVRGVLSKKSLQGKERHQQWLAGLSYVLRERILSTTTPKNRDLTPLLATLDKIIELDPDSQYGIGAKKFRHYWDPATFNTIRNGYYTRGDQTLGFEKDWHIDVSSSIKGAGTYVFSLVPVENGGMVSRNFRLVVDGKVVTTPNIPADKNTKTVEFTVPDIPQGAKVEVWLTAQCNNGWMESSGFISMEKK